MFFVNDYGKGAHKKILEKLIETNNTVQNGYGEDEYCLSAKEKIKKVCGNDNLDIFFTAGGTQTNLIVIQSLLKSYEGVISCDTGHISTHEAGAIENTGHKVILLNNNEGKLYASDVEKYIKDFNDDKNNVHIVHPKMVYISFPTEYGTLYSKSELEKIYEVCKKYDLLFFIDGARLGYGLMSEKCDFTIKDLCKLCDVFYIGATKIGALIGEAIVFCNNKITPKNFKTIIKQFGALLAKGRLLGIQFDVLFTDNLYFEISKNAIECAMILKNAFKEKGYKLYVDSYTNQQFVLLTKGEIDKLSKNIKFAVWRKYDERYFISRFVTDFASTKEEIYKLIELL